MKEILWPWFLTRVIEYFVGVTFASVVLVATLTNQSLAEIFDTIVWVVLVSGTYLIVYLYIGISFIVAWIVARTISSRFALFATATLLPVHWILFGYGIHQLDPGDGLSIRFFEISKWFIFGGTLASLMSSVWFLRSLDGKR